MMNPRELLLHSRVDPGDGVSIHVDRTSAGWEFIGLTVHALKPGAPFQSRVTAANMPSCC